MNPYYLLLFQVVNVVCCFVPVLLFVMFYILSYYIPKKLTERLDIPFDEALDLTNVIITGKHLDK